MMRRNVRSLTFAAALTLAGAIEVAAAEAKFDFEALRARAQSLAVQPRVVPKRFPNGCGNSATIATMSSA